MKVNRPIYSELILKSGDNFVQALPNGDALELDISINGEVAIIEEVNEVTPENVYHFAFGENVAWNNIPATWVYDSYNWFVIDESLTHIYILLSDSDGQWKLPRGSSGDMIAQLKSDGSFDQMADTEEKFPQLLQLFDVMTVDIDMSLGNALLRNGDETSIYTIENGVEYLFPTENMFGNNGKIKNLHVNDGIYTISGFSVGAEEKTVSIVVINGIFHIVATDDNGTLYPVKLEGSFTPVSDFIIGTECKLRDTNLAGIWADDLVTDDNGTIEEYTQALSEYVPAGYIGEPIIASNDGAGVSFPVCSPDDWFSVGV